MYYVENFKWYVDACKVFAGTLKCLFVVPKTITPNLTLEV